RRARGRLLLHRPRDRHVHLRSRRLELRHHALRPQLSRRGPARLRRRLLQRAVARAGEPHPEPGGRSVRRRLQLQQRQLPAPRAVRSRRVQPMTTALRTAAAIALTALACGRSQPETMKSEPASHDATAPSAITPQVECVIPHGGGSYTSYWSYDDEGV